ncbi:MAG: hypothetical protein AAGK74_08370, partial [Chloroflexota bacterium]
MARLSLNRYDWLNVAVIVLTLVIIVIAPYRIDHDASWFLHVANLMLGGAVPNIDIIDINLPMIQYISIVVVLLSRMTGLTQAMALLFFVFGLSVYSSLMVRYLLGRYGFNGRGAGYASLAALVISLLTLHFKATRYYAQREHIFILLLLPGFALRFARWQNREVPLWLALLVGFLAAVGVCIKPHFLLLALLPELYWLAVHRRLRPALAPEVWVFGVVGLVYLLHPYLVYPANFYASMTENAVAYYQFWDAVPLTAILRSSNSLFTLAGVAVAMAVAIRERNPLLRDLIGGIALVTLAAHIAYVAQLRAYTYQFIPAIYGLFVLFAFLFERLANANIRMTLLKRVAAYIPLVAFAVMLIIDFNAFWREHRVLSSFTPPFHQQINTAASRGDDVLFLGYDFHRYSDLTVRGVWQAHQYPVAYQVIFEM